MFNSIKAQIYFMLGLLASALLVQIYLSYTNQDSFISGIDLTEQAVTKVGLVREVERGVLDLQRNVLIYKETANDSIINRFNTILQEIKQGLDTLDTMSSNDIDAIKYRDYIFRMKQHLKDYHDNFLAVIDGRRQREILFNQKLLVDLAELEQQVIAYNGLAAQNKNQLLNHLSQSRNIALLYLLSQDYENITLFNHHITQASQLVQPTQAEPLLKQLQIIKNDFAKLSQVTRGYVFLTNVVMTGSANEFLYLSQQLNKYVASQLSTTNEQVKATLTHAQLRNNIIAFIGILAAITCALYFVYRIITPIKSLTEIFRKLADAEDIKRIPNLKREDEIGELARAAHVFQKNNKNTISLLAQSNQLNQDLLKATEKAEQATEFKSIFLANMSHEIRTPINGISGLIDLCLATELTHRQRDFLDKAAYSTNLLMSLVNDILDFSKIEAGKLSIEYIQFSLEAIIDNLMANIAPRSYEKNLHLNCEIAPNLPRLFMGDPLRVNQILFNLCTNAVKFTSIGSITITVLFEAIPNNDKQIKLILSVSDTGVGLTEQQIDNIFNAFIQADGSISRKYGGTGLGLSIVKQLVKLMGGEISVNSTPDVGSSFCVELMLDVVDQTDILFDCSSLKPNSIVYLNEELPLLNQRYCDYLQSALLRADNLNAIDFTEHADIKFVLIDVQETDDIADIAQVLRRLENKTVSVCLLCENNQVSMLQGIQNDFQFSCLTVPILPSQLKKLFSDEITPLSSLSKPREQTFVFDSEIIVLLVDDNHINLIVASEMLKQLGVTVIMAENGQIALDIVQETKKIDLILMDIQMPVKDGYTATKELRQLGYNDLLICGLSANAMQIDHDKAIECGMNDYLTKPIVKEKLAALLIRYFTVNNRVFEH
ncbi:ATP-binding protein [Pseudoalteromonas tunicata]|uniref:ATP-binding protein n=1 Tax=Pseudoalteromonas tunicata TaxID=314281 RepID=UPI00273D6D88|nr:ATP-binding protein [Pseudoalteromonas tunicata]MDP4982314.1 ATP-binding protein [Pseudoalteromonas tunicata]